MRVALYSVCALALTLCVPQLASAQVAVELESGTVFTGRNDVRIPSLGGTLFSLKDDLSPETKAFLRLRLSYDFQKTHTLSLLYAPLEIQSGGQLSRDLLYNGTRFEVGTSLLGIYKFNSYRLTYRYNFFNTPQLVFGLGLTAKIRDANIILSSSELSAQRKSLGIVPLVNFSVWWRLDKRFGVLFEGDALAGPGGRAEDVRLAATFELSDSLGLRAGYRILEGGAGNERVFGFALFHYLSASVSYIF